MSYDRGHKPVCRVLVHTATLVCLVWGSAAVDKQCGWDKHMSDTQVSPSNTRRLIDISVTIHPGLPCWDQVDGLGEHRELVERQDQGGVAFVSKVHLGAHTATHFDAPSHFLQEAFDSGRGVESIQLSIMNGTVCMHCQYKDRISHTYLSCRSCFGGGCPA